MASCHGRQNAQHLSQIASTLFRAKGIALPSSGGNAMNTSAEQMADQGILLVDDDPGILKALSWVLEDQGYQVASTSDSHQALETLERKGFRLVITDLAMPDTDGFTLLRKAKDLNPGTRVIVMTANQEPKSRAEAFALRADGYLMKPFDIIDLKKQVSRCLQPSEEA